MKVLIVRHAHAGERAAFFARTGRPDRERPLTAEGRRKFRRGLPGLKRVAPKLRTIATSPYVRAAQTASLLAERFHKADRLVLPALAHGGRPADALAWLKRRGPDTSVALVGHEPDLGRLIGVLVTGRPDAPFSLKKGGAALIEFDGKAAAGAGDVVWVLTPAVMKKLA